uniref:DUF7789 domain-containing protein n=1 Tax=Pygocentrus nattereri TaxID=42514 RepID=A0AAR2JWC9_PYGNA
MDEIRPLLSPQRLQSVDLPSPNLLPRHRDLLPTPCGPIKRWSELPCLVKIYFCFTLSSLLALLILTVFNIQRERVSKGSDDDDFTVSLIQLVSILFCMYYITRGVLQENRQELIVFVLSVLVVMVRSVVNFSVLTTHDLLLLLCLCILILTSGTSMSYAHTVVLGIGVVWACFTAAVGAIAVLKEVKPLVWIFVLMNLPQLAYFIYLLYSIISQWGQSKTYSLEAAAITGCVVSVTIKSVLFWGLYRLYHSFGQGLRERMFAADKQ